MGSITLLERTPGDLALGREFHQQCTDQHAEMLANWNVIIAANRGPVSFEASEDGDFQSQRGTGGLVTALVGLCQHVTHASWIACAHSEADVAWQQAGVSSLDGMDHIRLQFLGVDEAVYKRYYNVIANPLLWFLQHSMWDTPRSPVIDRATWTAWDNGYVAINRLFAEAIADQVRSASNPTLVG